MKLVIPTHKRAHLISTPFLKVFKDFDKYILFHDEEAKLEYLNYNDYKDINLIVTNQPATKSGSGLAQNRKYFIENYVEHGEWVLFCDDNVISVYGLFPEDLWKKPEHEKLNELDFSYWENKLFNRRIGEIKEYANAIGAYHVGFQTSKNYFFAKKKYRERGYVLGKMTLWKKDNNFIYDEPFCSMEDFHHTAMHIVNYGKVLICDYLWANATHFQGGGLGTKENRKPNQVASIKYLVSRYPELIKVKKRKDNYPDLRFPNMSDENFLKWRKKYLEFLKHYDFEYKRLKWIKKQ